MVIFSMCASGDPSPRGIEFLFSRNRLNVAIRAPKPGNRGRRPALVRTRCSSIAQMGLRERVLPGGGGRHCGRGPGGGDGS